MTFKVMGIDVQGVGLEAFQSGAFLLFGILMHNDTCIYIYSIL